MRYAIEVENVVKDYGDFRLGPLTFAVPEGCICGFIGQNGAGKTTTIRLILDAMRRDSGSVRVFGQEVSGNPALKEDIGVVFDEMGFHEFLTAREIGTMMRSIYRNWDEAVYRTYLDRFALPSKKKCGDFSRGMRMKLQIAAALSHRARLLVMDEPTSGLDPVVRAEMLEIFQEFVIAEDHTILLSSHITADIERIADEIVFVHGGRIVLTGEKDGLLERHGILKCGKEQAEQVRGAFVVARRASAYGTEILVNDRRAAAREYPELVPEMASLEEMMLYYVLTSGAVEVSG